MKESARKRRAISRPLWKGGRAPSINVDTKITHNYEVYRTLLVNKNDVPLFLVVDGANRYDSKLLEPLLNQRFRPTKKLRYRQNLCLNAGFIGKDQTVKDNGFICHIRPRDEEKKELENNPEFRAKRWVVEACNSWLKRFRKLCPRHEKTQNSFVALLTSAMGMITFNKVMEIYP